MQDVFVEQLGNMVVDAGKAGRLQPGRRLVIPLAAFAQALDSMNTLWDQLVADGVLTRTQAEVVPVCRN